MGAEAVRLYKRNTKASKAVDLAIRNGKRDFKKGRG